MKKKVTKSTAAFTVDFTNIDSYDEAVYEIARAKFANNIPLSYDDMKAILCKYQDLMFSNGNNCVIKDENGKIHFFKAIPHKCENTCKNCNNCTKCDTKKPWYKRFWNWITRKK